MAIGSAGWLEIVASACTALAALASWAAVWQARQMWRAGLLPHLQVQSLSRPLAFNGGARLTLEIHNVGGAAARTAHFVAFNDAQRCYGLVPPAGFMKPGGHARIITGLEAPSDRIWTQNGVLFCLDAEGVAHVWSFNGEHRILRSNWRRKLKTTSIEKAVAAFYPDVDLLTLEGVGWSLEEQSSSLALTES